MASVRRPGRMTLRLRLYTLVIAGTVLLALAIRFAYAGIAAIRPSLPPGSARTIPETDVNPYGANFFLDREVEPWKLDKTLQMASQAGLGWVKQQFPWEEVEPRRKGEFLEPMTKASSWGKFDAIVAACEEHNLQIIARLDRPPDWSRQDNTYKERPPDNLEDYGDYVYAFVKRYAGRVNYVQIWNEPNIFPEWGNQPVDPAQYVELLKIAYRRAKEANPSVLVLSAPLALTLGQPHPEPGKWIAMSDLDFLEAMYQAGAADYLDIYSANAFGMDRPPEDPPDPKVLNFQRVLLHRQIMERFGDARKPVWFNEYGWNAAPESMPAVRLIWRRVTEAEQAEYTVRGISLARREWPWAGVFMIWYFRQVGSIPTDRADYYFRMVDVDFTPRPVYLAVQHAATTRSIPGPGLYQETHPGLDLQGNWDTIIDPDASAGKVVQSETPGDRATFSFRGSGIDVLVHQDSASGRLRVSLDGHTVPGLPTDDQGQSYIELYSAGTRHQAVLPLAHGLGPETHTVVLTVSGDSHPSSTGQRCALDAFQIVEGERVPFPALPFVLVVAALGVDLTLLWRTWRRGRWILRSS